MRCFKLQLLVAVVLLGGPAVGAGPSAGADETKQSKSALPDDYSCSLCHSKKGELWTEGTPLATEADLQNDIHWQKGLLCHDCHGGSATIAGFKNHRDDPSFRKLGSPIDVPAFCGHCHSNIDYMRRFVPSARTDQESEYWTSGHGRHLKASSEGENAKVDTSVATCVNCHGGHGIRSVHDRESPVYPTHVAETCAHCHANPEVMQGRTYHGHPLGYHQYDEWRHSVHGQALMDKGDLSAATCNDCHGNHGAMPPGVDSVANACGTCHGKISSLFAEANMKHKFAEVGLPGCATCHGTHAIRHPSDEMLGMGDGTVCSKCHNPQNPQYGAAVAGAKMAAKIRSELEQLKQGISVAEGTIHEAARLGMEVRGPHFDLRQATDALTNARTELHSFKPAPVEEALKQGLTITSAVQVQAEKTLQEHTNRRIWLAMSLIPILIVVCLLLLYIRTLKPEAASHEVSARR